MIELISNLTHQNKKKVQNGTSTKWKPMENFKEIRQ